MKQVAAILLLLLLLFNFVGYRVWFGYLQTQSDEKVQVALDRNEYDENDLVTVKIPLYLPYFTNWKEFESYNGSVEVDGRHYNYVKRKVFNDTLILLCIPNREKNLIADVKNEYTRLANQGDNSMPGKKMTVLLSKSLIALCTENIVLDKTGLAELLPNRCTVQNDDATCTTPIAVPWHPPRVSDRILFWNYAA